MTASEARILSRTSRPSRVSELRKHVNEKIKTAAHLGERDLIDPLAGFQAPYMSADSDQLWADLTEDGYLVDHNYHRASTHHSFSIGTTIRLVW